ncbi:hypothetical protein [Pedobacter sp. UYP1]|uniref:hypothetical protein n=1 Tax=Pedobacter sp. UYP1 TaxID=1756396 RepID=UPI0033973817
MFPADTGRSGIGFDSGFQRKIVKMEEARKETEKLSKIITAYADIWADVMLDKNLDQHLKGISEDLGHLNKLIDYKDARHLNTVRYYRIANQLSLLQEIVRDKLARIKS